MRGIGNYSIELSNLNLNYRLKTIRIVKKISKLYPLLVYSFEKLKIAKNQCLSFILNYNFFLANIIQFKRQSSNSFTRQIKNCIA